MRKQMKIAAVVSATALLAIGASFTSFAAKNGTWELKDEGWMCFNSNGEEYKDEFCLSQGKEYYVDDEGIMVTSSWIDHNDATYYVDEDGAMVTNDWRWLTPADDEDAEEEKYYFGANGKMVTGKKVIDNKTYYFDTDGKMLTGWVAYDSTSKIAQSAEAYAANVVFCNEDGSRVSADWIHTWAPEVAEDDQESDNMTWYYAKSSGVLQTKKAHDIKGKDYLFDSEGKMLTGWVEFDGTNYSAERSALGTTNTYYFCDETDGDVKKNRWVKTWQPNEYAAEDSDNSQYWYYIGKDGKVFVPTNAVVADGVTFVNGEDGGSFSTTTSTAELKEIGGKTYAFKDNGQMWSGLVDITGKGRMYFGGKDDGAMKTGAVMIEDQDDYAYKFYFGDKDTKYATPANATVNGNYVKGVAVTGAAGGYLYKNGLLVKATDAKYEVENLNGVDYIINTSGAIQTSSKEYKEDGVVVVNAKSTAATDTTPANTVTFYNLTTDGIFKGAVKTGTVAEVH